ncbi:MAG TPA: phosphoribosylanthranilate isomerase [Acidimicrobiales bacterium]
MFVKICGITNEEDALLSIAMGADALGFIFAPSSRQVSVATVAGIVPRLPPEIVTFGVFRDELPVRVISAVQEAGLKGAQLHGQESAEDTALVTASVRHVIKAFAATSVGLGHASSYAVDAFLLDSADPGSGRVFDWRLAEALPRTRRLILSGGLHPGNVAEAINLVHPWGVDVSSGVESAPGLKDPTKVREFVAAVRAVEPEEYSSDLDSPYDWQEEP